MLVLPDGSCSTYVATILSNEVALLKKIKYQYYKLGPAEPGHCNEVATK